MHIPHSAPPHGQEPVRWMGNFENPKRALVLLHGRGSSAEEILSVTAYFPVPSDVIVLAPQAEIGSWYPRRFLEPQAVNQPKLDSALERVETIFSWLFATCAIDTAHVALAGFSQGACLAAEYVKRNPTHYAAVALFSGGLIGDDDEVSRVIAGDLSATPLYIGCDEVDAHIPKERVEATAAYFTARGAAVTMRLYRGLGHTIHQEGISFLNTALN